MHMIRDDKGITMVEIMVSVAVLAIVMLVFYNCMKFSGNMMTKTSDVDRDNDAFQRATSQYFNEEANKGYKLGSDGVVTYTFTVEGTTDTVDANVDYKELYFTLSNGSYSISDTPSGDYRRLLIFSTGD